MIFRNETEVVNWLETCSLEEDVYVSKTSFYYFWRVFHSQIVPERLKGKIKLSKDETEIVTLTITVTDSNQVKHRKHLTLRVRYDRKG
jgi:hypothetical protein